jgi:hypothetical protein
MACGPKAAPAGMPALQTGGLLHVEPAFLPPLPQLHTWPWPNLSYVEVKAVPDELG